MIAAILRQQCRAPANGPVSKSAANFELTVPIGLVWRLLEPSDSKPR